jgi:hypothetical protein
VHLLGETEDELPLRQEQIYEEFYTGTGVYFLPASTPIFCSFFFQPHNNTIVPKIAECQAMGSKLQAASNDTGPLRMCDDMLDATPTSSCLKM